MTHKRAGFAAASAMSNSVNIAGYEVGTGNPCFIIAEAGVNHNGDPKLAFELIKAAAEAGADAVKFQTFQADQLVTFTAPKAAYQKRNTGLEESQLEMLRRLELPDEIYPELIEASRRLDLVFLSTPFDELSADRLHGWAVPAFKVSSGDLTHLPLLEHLASYHKPILLSTGMATLEETSSAVETIRRRNNEQIVLLHCVSNYPADPADCNLRAMQTMAEALAVPIGFSDHTLGIEVALAAVALGATVIEKHFTLDRTLPGPDHKASLTPDELGQLVRSIRIVESALGDGRKVPRPSEADTAAVARRSLVAAQTIPAGSIIEEHMIVVRRPGSGLPPSQKRAWIGRTSRETIPAGTLLNWNQLK